MQSKPIAFFDVDNTLYDGHSYFDFLPENFAAGVVSSSTISESLLIGMKYKNGRLPYEQALHDILNVYARGLKGQSLTRLETLAHSFYAKSNKFFGYVDPLFAKLRTTHELILVSGEPQFMAAAVAQRVGATGYFSSMFSVDGDTFTGKVEKYVALRGEKEALIRLNFSSERLERSLAVGDSEGDIGMLESVKKPICVNPTPALKHLALEKGWVIVTDKTFATLFKKYRPPK